jgi:negative regulator of sigma E activity
MSSEQISIDEQLSALSDGELERGPARFLLRRVENDAGLTQRFERYQLIRACLRREYKSFDSDSFCAGVMAQIDAEAAPQTTRARSPWVNRVLGGAIAAGVAAAALFATSVQAPAPAPEIATRTMSQPPADSGLRFNLAAQPVAAHATTILQPADPRLEAYLVRHSGAVATVGQRGALPYVYALGVRTRSDAAAPAQEEVDPNVRPAAAVGAHGQ